MRPALKRSKSLWDGLKIVPDKTDLLRQTRNSFLTKNATKIGCNSKKQPFSVALCPYHRKTFLRSDEDEKTVQ